MKRILSLLCLMLMLSLVAFAKGNEMPQYDITGAGSGNEGMLLVKVFVYSKKVTDHLLHIEVLEFLPIDIIFDIHIATALSHFCLDINVVCHMFVNIFV